MLSRKIIRTILNCAQRKTLKLNCNQLPVIHTTHFHSSSKWAAKLFLDKENKFAHNVLEQSLKPYKILRLDGESDTSAPSNTIIITTAKELPKFVLKPPSLENANEISNTEFFKYFKTLAEFCTQTGTCLSDERFREFVLLFCDICHKLTDEQLVEVLRLIAKLPPEQSVRAANFVELWNALDIECCRRVESWKSDQLLLVCDAWYVLNLARITEFVWEAIRKLGRKVRRMPAEQLVQTMFLCNIARRTIYDMFDFEENLARCVKEMTLQELGIMSMGFFKTQTPIRNPELIEHLYKRLMAELDTVEDITLVAILKVLRYSSKIPQADIMMELMDKLSNYINKMSLLGCLHTALLGSDIQTCHDKLLEGILERFVNEVETARLKDMERICFAIGVFSYRSPNGLEKVLFSKILTSLNSRIEEILKYPRAFTTCLHFLSVVGFYDPDMINAVLEPKFLRHTFGKNLQMGREIFHLDSFIKINLRDTYEGHQVPDKMRRTMGKLLTNYIPERNSKYNLNKTDTFLLEIKECIDRIHRPNVLKQVLPHFERPDLIICYDSKQRKAIPIDAQCPEDYSGTILTRNELLGSLNSPNVETVAVVVGGWNNVVRHKDRNTGLFDMKLSQLKLLGYKPIVIYWHVWRELETPKDRQTFLKRKLATVNID